VNKLKVRKESGKYSGYNVIVEIGNKSWSSYFSAPSESVDHAGLKYLTDRYPIITTEKRAEEFKRLYKNLWIDITEYQLDLMKHSLGISYKKKKPYRNYFFTQENDKDWNELVEKGLAMKGTKHPNNDEFIYFWCSKQGVEFVLGKSVSEKLYKEL
jgi:hypothetical protein